jgi:hypothetical protein
MATDPRLATAPLHGRRQPSSLGRYPLRARWHGKRQKLAVGRIAPSADQVARRKSPGQVRASQARNAWRVPKAPAITH